ncbi:hypothetical protein SS50377_24526 [Spironucleus salmonicida]|uniref:Uncharacterized protein n=1 Tax=Spironucleus salmonicida TaxID=348837 RepID=V6LQE9_9EUKA|nr:hypothetical protein SS50377_24526 [Spironucleus salmonicida]|eukprot:EST45931.1 Hypothetical protein SS50377_13910 [Spironucleus salmonicida]
MYQQLVQSKFKDSTSFMTPILNFLGIYQLVPDLSIIPSLIQQPEDSNKTFSLLNQQVFKDSQKCNYLFILKIQSHFKSIQEAFKLCNSLEKQALTKLIKPIYINFSKSSYRILRVIAVIIASIFDFPSLSTDICPGIRAFLPSQDSFQDPDPDVRLQALLQNCVEPINLLFDDNETVRTFATAMIKPQQIQDNLILGNIRSARIFAISQLMLKKNYFKQIIKICFDQQSQIILQIAKDMLIAFAVTGFDIKKFEVDISFQSEVEVCFQLCIFIALKEKEVVDKKFFQYFDQKQFGFNEKDKIKKINELISNICLADMNQKIQELLSRISSFQSQDVSYCLDLFLNSYIEEITDNQILYDLCQQILNPQQIKKLFKNDANYTKHLNKKLVEFEKQINLMQVESIDFNQILSITPLNFPDIDSIKLFYQNCQFLDISFNDKDEVFFIKVSQLSELLFILLLRMKEGGERDNASTQAFINYLNYLISQYGKILYNILYEGVIIDDENIDKQLTRLSLFFSFLNKLLIILGNSRKAFKNFQIPNMVQLSILLYSLKYYLFTAQDVNKLKDDNLISVCQELQNQVFSMLEFQDKVIISCIDLPLFRSQLQKILKQKLKIDELFTSLVFAFKLISNYNIDQEYEFSKLQKDLQPENQLGQCFSKEINSFFKAQKTDLKKVKKEWIKISLWAQNKSIYEGLTSGLDSSELQKFQHL